MDKEEMKQASATMEEEENKEGMKHAVDTMEENWMKMVFEIMDKERYNRYQNNGRKKQGKVRDKTGYLDKPRKR